MSKKKMLTAAFALGLIGTFGAQAYDPVATCNLSQTQFNGWFVSQPPAKNGIVTFANSVGFPTNNTVCDFYKWAHQMFLWTTSPLGGGILIDSTVFFDVSIDPATGNATYVSNAGGGTKNNAFALRGAKPVQIQPGGQAGGGDTLMSLNGSLIYFSMHANDVYAWFNTAVSNGVLPATTPFPTTQAELDAIVNYAKANGATLGDANALTMELKTAWVDAATVSPLSAYVTISAAVPNYTKVSTTSWTINAQQPSVVKTLALVGIHVVGPVQGHPEMVWATFEHGQNAPNNTFYVSIPDPFFAPIPVPYNSNGTWNFMTNGGSQTGALVSQMTVDGSTGAITATAGNTIGPNNVYRAMPWGNAPTPAAANNNSQLISLNNDVRGMLSALGDVRSNYFQVGAVWTQNGSIPSSGTDTAKQIGSKLLSNTTMETYHQTNKNGCFGCHFASSSTGTSHLFSTTNNPLVPPSK